ncbi:MAG: hypothetical protein WC952_10405 [Desulfobulbaceae bacterium]|jgi:hypothetical protein
MADLLLAGAQDTRWVFPQSRVCPRSFLSRGRRSSRGRGLELIIDRMERAELRAGRNDRRTVDVDKKAEKGNRVRERLK